MLLEAAGLKVQLVNARSVKNAPGRAKTDLLTELQGIAPGQEADRSRQQTIMLSGMS